jgi:hypothetical protein
MKSIRTSLHSRVHAWINTFGFQLNNTQTDRRNNVTTNHYFFETFNLLEKEKKGDHKASKFLCFDTYGEKINVKSLLDVQVAFFENISQLK